MDVRIAVSSFLIFFLGVTVSIGIQSLYAKEPGKIEVPNIKIDSNHSSKDMARKAGEAPKDFNFTNQITDKSSAIQKSQNGGLVTGQNSTQVTNSSESTINNSPKLNNGPPPPGIRLGDGG